MSNNIWFYKLKGQVKGPIDRSTLEILVQQRVLPPHAMVWHQGLPAWMPFSKAKNIPVGTAAPAAASEPVSTPAPAKKPGASGKAPVASFLSAMQPPANLPTEQAPPEEPPPPYEPPVMAPPPPRGPRLQPMDPAEAVRELKRHQRRKAVSKAPYFIGAGVLLILIFSGILLLRGSGTEKQVSAPPPSTAAPAASTPTAEIKKTEAPAAPVPAPAPMPTDPEQKKMWLLTDYDNLERSPSALFAEKVKRLDSLEDQYKDEIWAKAVDQRRRALRRNMERSASELIDTIRKAALAKMDQHDYKGALAEFDKFPDEFKHTEAQMGLEKVRDDVRNRAMAQLQEADAAAQPHLQASRFKEARDTYQSLLSYNLPEMELQLRARMAEIADAEKRGPRPGEGKQANLKTGQAYYRADIYTGVPGVVDLYDAACKEALLGDVQKALTKCDLVNYPRSAVFYYATGIAHARNSKFGEARRAFDHAKRLALPGKEFESRLISARGQIALSDVAMMSTIKVLDDTSRKALEIDPNNAHAYFIQGVYCDMMAQSEDDSGTQQIFQDQAHKAFTQANELDPIYADLAAQNSRDKYAYKGTGGNPNLLSVVQVTNTASDRQSLGSGWIFHTDGKTAYVMTNYHVVENYKSLKMLYQYEQAGNLIRKETSAVTVLETDKDSDLAVLKIEATRELRPLSIRTSAGLTVPMKVTCIGHPGGLDFSVVSGELASLNRSYKGKRHLQVAANVTHGISGGPVLDEKGIVVGVMVAGWDQFAGQGVAIIPERVIDLCEKVKVKIDIRE